MFAGHFATAIVFQRWYPNISPYTLTLGVTFLDILCGILTFFGFEGFVKDYDASWLGIEIHCDYSHNLIASILLSLLYGQMTGALVPGFIASFAHFIGDWLVHNDDLLLDPFSKIIVGGTGFWQTYPTATFYFEGLLCIACGVYGSTGRWSRIASALIVVIHFQSKFLIPRVLGPVLDLDTIPRQRLTSIILTSSFVIPALLLAYLLSKDKQYKQRRD